MYERVLKNGCCYENSQVFRRSGEAQAAMTLHDRVVLVVLAVLLCCCSPAQSKSFVSAELSILHQQNDVALQPLPDGLFASSNIPVEVLHFEVILQNCKIGTTVDKPGGFGPYMEVVVFSDSCDLDLAATRASARGAMALVVLTTSQTAFELNNFAWTEFPTGPQPMAVPALLLLAGASQAVIGILQTNDGLVARQLYVTPEEKPMVSTVAPWPVFVVAFASLLLVGIACRFHHRLKVCLSLSCCCSPRSFILCLPPSPFSLSLALCILYLSLSILALPHLSLESSSTPLCVRLFCQARDRVLALTCCLAEDFVVFWVDGTEPAIICRRSRE
eukprot:m.219804 g.219804  ORF g.219804 m.219804 type:complete len:332 (+) comp18699_c0_seq3:37-1032(+)